MEGNNTVFTIGYSGFEKEQELFRKLAEHGINVLIDIRSMPFSKIYPQYNKPYLEKQCRLHGVLYRHYAEEFGARQMNVRFITYGKVDFEAFARSERFKSGMDKVKAALELGYKPCLLCAEKDPITCHRSILVGRNLCENGINVIHLYPSAKKESQEDLEKRLIQMYYPNPWQIDLFGDETPWETMRKESYRKQNRKIGFTTDPEEKGKPKKE